MGERRLYQFSNTRRESHANQPYHWRVHVPQGRVRRGREGHVIHHNRLDFGGRGRIPQPTRLIRHSSTDWLFGAIVGTIFAILGFAVGVLVINWVGRVVFKADVSFNELVRTLGLAYVWQVVGVLGILAAFSEALSCVVGPVQIIAMILMIIAWFIAAKEALDLEWVQTIVTVILGWLAQFVITTFITGLALGLLELGGCSDGRSVWPLGFSHCLLRARWSQDVAADEIVVHNQ